MFERVIGFLACVTILIAPIVIAMLYALYRRRPVVICPLCRQPTEPPQFPSWVIWVCILFFPLGLLALLVGKNPATCQKCGRTFRDSEIGSAILSETIKSRSSEVSISTTGESGLLDGSSSKYGEEQVCENCKRRIGKLETAHLWQDHVVCAQCRRLLEIG